MNLTFKMYKIFLEGPRSTHHSLTKSCGKHWLNTELFFNILADIIPTEHNLT